MPNNKYLKALRQSYDDSKEILKNFTNKDYNLSEMKQKLMESRKVFGNAFFLIPAETVELIEEESRLNEAGKSEVQDMLETINLATFSCNIFQRSGFEVGINNFFNTVTATTQTFTEQEIGFFLKLKLKALQDELRNNDDLESVLKKIFPLNIKKYYLFKGKEANKYLERCIMDFRQKLSRKSLDELLDIDGTDKISLQCDLDTFVQERWEYLYYKKRTSRSSVFDHTLDARKIRKEEIFPEELCDDGDVFIENSGTQHGTSVASIDKDERANDNSSSNRSSSPLPARPPKRPASTANPTRKPKHKIRKTAQVWTQEEVDALEKGLKKVKGPFWSDILKDEKFKDILYRRTGGNLKDKARTAISQMEREGLEPHEMGPYRYVKNPEP